MEIKKTEEPTENLFICKCCWKECRDSRVRIIIEEYKDKWIYHNNGYVICQDCYLEAISAYDIKLNEIIGNIQGLNLKPIENELKIVKRILLLRQVNLSRLVNELERLENEGNENDKNKENQGTT